MEGTLTEEKPPQSVVKPIALYVLGWVLLLLGIGVAEYLVNPEPEYNSAGRALNIASLVVAGIGMFAVPIGTARIATVGGREQQYRMIAAVASLGVFVVGVWIAILLVVLLRGGA